uniref:Uncharacterized protein n=1 Tax=Caenorhabditis japonica TaxID=281687 RepID=A0A8R1IHF5_CAEJA
MQLAPKWPTPAKFVPSFTYYSPFHKYSAPLKVFCLGTPGQNCSTPEITFVPEDIHEADRCMKKWLLQP